MECQQPWARTLTSSAVVLADHSGGLPFLAMVGTGLVLEPNWDECDDGSKVSFLCETIVWNTGNRVSLVKSVLRRRFIKLVGDFSEAFAYSVLDGIWDKKSNSVVVDTSTFVIPHKVATSETLTGVTELCAGIGAMSLGMEAAGCRVHLKNDIRIQFTDFLNTDGFSNTVCGDISENATIFRIYEKHPQSSILTAGFSCQPWSRLGDSGKMQDARSNTLASALKAGFYLRSSAIMLECVAESGQDADVQSLIRSFCHQTGFWAAEQVLHLDHVWPSRRTRWWCLLTNPSVPKFDFKPFPKHAFVPTVGHVLPEFPTWPESQIQQLLIDAYEYGCFEKFTGIPKVAIDLNKPLPTALHGWGNQLMGCPCGCRSAPLSLARLQEKGLWGAVLPLPWTFQVQGSSVQAGRHIHPWELAILTGTSAERSWMPSLKLSLCGLGQMATPFHSGWIISHLVFHTGKSLGWQFCLTPEQVLWDVASRAFASRNSILPHLQHSEKVSGFVDDMHKLLVGHHQDRFVPGSVSQTATEVVSIEQGDESHIGSKVEEVNDPSRVLPVLDAPEFDPAPDASQPIVDDGYADPHWDCPYDDCIICIQNGLKPPIEIVGTRTDDDDDDVGFVHSVQPHDISPTILFTVEENNLAQEPKAVPFSFSSCGGHPAFSSQKRSQPPEDPNSETAVEDLPPIKRPRIENAPTPAISFQLEHKSARVVVLHQGLEGPQLIRVSKDEPIRSVVVAETKLHQPSQSFRVCDTIGQAVGLSDYPQAFQHIHLHDDGPWSPSPCHDNCQPPHWFLPGESCSRISMLYRQESWVAKDEMDYYLQVFSVAGLASGIPSLVFDDLPCQFEEWVLDCAAVSQISLPVVSAVLLDQHWIPFAFFTGAGGVLQVYTSQEGCELCQYCDFRDPYSAIPMPRLFDADCGFQTVGWLIHVILDPTIRHQDTTFGSCFSPVSAPAAAGWRRLFEHHLFVEGIASAIVFPTRIKLGGTKSETIDVKLQDLLQSHAVPSSCSADRASVILDKLGRPAVVKAFRAQRPWAELKALANAASPKLQLVLPSELEVAIQSKASEGKPVGDRSRKQKMQKPIPIPVTLKPSDISIPDGVFKHGKDIQVKQIPLSTIGKASQGVVLVTASQAKPYLSVLKPISQEGLALLVLDHADPSCNGIGQIVQFPARFEQTGEPLITRARLIQLGESEVSRHIPSNPLSVEEVDTHVLRALVFRDEFEGSWEDFVLHPVKYLLEQNAELIGGSGHDSNIVDVWDRQFVSHKLEKLPPRQADLFIVSLRVMNVDIDPLSKSGRVATYFEPREDSGRQPHESYRVIWLPKLDKGSVVASIQLAEHWACLARSGLKLGIRTKSDHAKVLHEQFRPAVPFLDASDLSTFIVGPMPYGATRAGLVKLFGQWDWKARPCQPRGRSADGNGVLWECQASTPPPFEIYTMKHADVLVSQVERKRPTDKPSSDILASAKTLAVLKQQSSSKPMGPPGLSGIDPLTINDPWTTYVPTTKQARVSVPGDHATSSFSNSFEAMSRAVDQKIEAKLAHLTQQQPTPEDVEMTPQVEGRMSEMEHRLSSLEAVVQSNHQQQQQQQNHVASQISNLQQQVDSQGSALQRHLDEKLTEQLSHIERLLGRGEKKFRGE